MAIHLEPRARFLSCGYCRGAVRRGRVARCACGAIAHPLCARELGRCPTLGCGARIRHARLVAVGPSGRRRRSLRAAVEAIAAGMLATLLLLATALVTGARVTIERRVVRSGSVFVETADERPVVPEPTVAIEEGPPPPLETLGPFEPVPRTTDAETDARFLELEIAPEGPDIACVARSRGSRPLVLPVGRAGGRHCFSWEVRTQGPPVKERGDGVVCRLPGDDDVVTVAPGESWRRVRLMPAWWREGRVNKPAGTECTLTLHYRYGGERYERRCGEEPPPSWSRLLVGTAHSNTITIVVPEEKR